MTDEALESTDAARAAALAYLDYAPRTVAEVSRRLLHAGFSESLVTEVVADLTASGLLNDRALAEAWVESRFRSKGYGAVRLESELRRKGVSPELIRTALESIGTQSACDRARQVAIERGASVDLRDVAQRRRLVGILQRRGFSWETIQQVLAEMVSNDA